MSRLRWRLCALLVVGLAAVFMPSSLDAQQINTASLPNGAIGVTYSFQLDGSCVPLLTCSWSATGLPPGLVISTDGQISGVPTTAQTAPVTVKLTVDSLPLLSDEKTLSLQIDPALAITTTSLPAGVAGVPYGPFTLQATGGIPAYTWSTASGTLPAGLVLSPAGVISGTPTTAGPVNFEIAVVDRSTPPQLVAKAFTLTVALAITTPSPLPPGAAGLSYPSLTFQATAGAALPYAWAVTAGALPAGMNLSAGGVLSGTPTSGGTFPFTIQVSSSAPVQTTTKAFTINVAGALSITTSSPLPGAVVALAYTPVTLQTAGGTGPFTWSVVTGTLPGGMSLSTAGVISGTPTSAGTSDFTIQVVSSAPVQTAQHTFALTVANALSITTASPLPPGVAGSGYSNLTFQTAGGTGPFSWSVVSGALPGGMSLSGPGVLSGTPAAAGTFNFTVQVVSSAPVQTAQKAFALTIASVLSITTASPLAPGVAGSAYPNLTFQTAGGSAPFTWSVQSGALPGGMSLGPGGVLSGTPTAAGTFNFTVQVASSAPAQTATKVFALTVVSALSITTSSPVPPGVIGSAYGPVSLQAAGGSTPYTWSVVLGSLPGGVSLGPGGVISGTPSAEGTFNFTVQVVSAAPTQTVQKTFTLVIVSTLTITTTSPLLPGAAGVTYPPLTLQAAGGTTPYTWSVISGALPAGMTLGPGGVLSGTPPSEGTFNFTVQVTTSPPVQTVQKTLSLTVVGALTITTASPLPSGVIGTAYPAVTLQAAGSTPPFTWSLALGTLPGGMSLSSGGVISGTPSTEGVFAFTIQVASSAPVQTAQKAFAMTVSGGLSITTASSLPTGVTGSVYGPLTFQPAGGAAPYTWSLASGALPEGMSLSPEGVLTGNPNSPGTFNFTIQVTSGAPTQTAQKAFTLTVAGALSITTSTPLPPAVRGAAYAPVTLQATGGAAPYTWSRISGGLPPGMSLSSAGVLNGTPTEAGTFNLTVQVATGAPAQTAQKDFTIVVVTSLTITTTSPLTPGLVGAAYGPLTLQAAGGSTPFTWSVISGALPNGLSLSAGGILSGTPTAAGTFNFTLRLTTSAPVQTTTRDMVMVVSLLPTSMSLQGIPSTVNPTQQVLLGLALPGPAPVTLSGSLTISFQSNAVVPIDDPAVQFSTGGRTITFTIPANSSAAVFPTGAMILAGTVSGTVTFTGRLQNGPNIAAGAMSIVPIAPQLSNIAATRNGQVLDIRVSGYSAERRVTNIQFGFDVRTSSGTQRVNLSRDVQAAFGAWYQDAASTRFGGSFVFRQTFTVQGDASAIESVTITFTNGQGGVTSTPVTFTSN